jgi:hypothetical protein
MPLLYSLVLFLPLLTLIHHFLPEAAADLNFTFKKGVSGLFRVHIVLRDDGRDEVPPQISSESPLDPSSISQFGRSEEQILIVQVDAENEPPTFATDGKLEVLQAQVFSVGLKSSAIKLQISYFEA